jgi:magnesium transporter
MITCRLYRNGQREQLDLEPSQISDVLGTDDATVWLDMDEPTPEKLEVLKEEFGFHELALEDSLHPHQRSKVDEYDTHYFLIVYALTPQAGSGHILHEVAVFVGPQYLVTIRKDPAYELTNVAKRWEAHSELVKEGGGYLLYILLDEIVDGYFTLLDEYEDQTEIVEDQVLAEQVDPQTRGTIFELKKHLLLFRRGAGPLREGLDALQRRTLPVVTPTLEPYYRDVYDHVLRATDFADNLRDILTSALDVHLSAVGNRLNEVMKVLTSWAAIILVPTLIAGIYGMNFVHMPELRWRYGYLYSLTLMGASALALYRAFKRKKWL